MNSPFLQTLMRCFTHRAFWIVLTAGILTVVALGFFLEQFENRFLATVQINQTRLFILATFFVSALLTAYFMIKAEPRRLSNLSGQWVAQGKKYEDFQYKILLSTISDIVFELDQNGTVVFINDRFNDLTRISLDDVMGHNFFNLFPEEQREKNRERYQKLVNGQLRPYRVKTFTEMYDGSSRQIEVGFRMVNQDENGKSHVVGIITDKQNVAAAKKAVVEAEQKYKDMFDNAVSGIYQSTPDGKFINVNPALAQILGYRSVEDVTKSVHSIATQIYVRPEERAIFKNRIDHDGKVIGFETQMYRKDGSKIWVVENARAVMGDDGYLKYYEGSLWDVTERREGESALKDAKLAAEMSARTKTEFLANMSHELRTPLNAIIGFSEIIKDEIMGPLQVPAYKEYAQDIYSSGNNLLKIISEILEVSKIEAGNRPLNEGPVRMSRAIAACLVILKGKVEDSKLTVDMDLHDDLPELIGEELVIKQMLLNLVGNAIKFTQPGGQITIRARMEDYTSRMLLEVIDTGIGMTPEDLEKATQPFWQANSDLARDTSGTGLGLTLVQSLAKMHGAVLELESVKGQGTTARVIFPKERILRPASSKPSTLQVENS